MKTDRMQPRIAGILIFCLLSSLFINFISIKASVNYYKKELLVRLDPLENIYKKKNTSNDKKTAKRSIVLLYGDSRISHWKPQLSIANHEIIKRGIGGQTTKQLSLRLYEDVLSHSPNIVVLQAGINDLKAIGVFPELRQDIVNHSKENLLDIVTRINNNNIHAIVLTIIPTGKPPLIRKLFWRNQINQAIDEVNSFLKNIRLENVHILDSSRLLGSGGFIDKSFQKNMLHLNELGYNQLNDLIESYYLNNIAD